MVSFATYYKDQITHSLMMVVIMYSVTLTKWPDLKLDFWDHEINLSEAYNTGLVFKLKWIFFCGNSNTTGPWLIFLLQVFVHPSLLTLSSYNFKWHWIQIKATRACTFAYQSFLRITLISNCPVNVLIIFAPYPVFVMPI